MKLKHTRVATLAATLITFGSLAGGANGALILTFNDNGNGTTTVVTSGSVDTTGFSGGSMVSGYVQGNFDTPENFWTGGVLNNASSVQYIVTWNAAPVMNAIGDITATSSSGSMFGFFSTLSSGINLASGYSSGQDISIFYPNSESTFASPITDFNIVEGTYSFTNGTGGDSVTLVVNLVPEPSLTLLLVLGALGLVTRRRRTYY